MQGFETGIKKGFKYQCWINIIIVSESVRVYANACIHSFIFKDKCLWYNIKLRNYLINEWSWIFLHFSSKLSSLSSVPLFSIILLIFQPSTSFNLSPFLFVSFLSMSLYFTYFHSPAVFLFWQNSLNPSVSETPLFMVPQPFFHTKNKFPDKTPHFVVLNQFNPLLTLFFYFLYLLM